MITLVLHAVCQQARPLAPLDQRVDERAERLVLGLPADGGARAAGVDDLTW